MSGRGEPDVLSKVRNFLDRRFGDLGVRGGSSVRVGLEVPKANEFSAQAHGVREVSQSTQKEFTEGLRPIPTSPDSRAAG